MNRDTYADVGHALRTSQQRAAQCPDMTGRDWRVLTAVWALTASYSRLTDRVTAAQVAQAAHLDERNTRRSLARLRDFGIIIREDCRGRRPAVTGVPQPGPQTTRVTDTPTRAAHDPGLDESTRAKETPPTRAAHGPPLREDREERQRGRARETPPAPPGLAGGQAAPQPHPTPLPPIAPHLQQQLERAMAGRNAQLAMRIDGAGDELAARHRTAPPTTIEPRSADAATG